MADDIVTRLFVATPYGLDDFRLLIDAAAEIKRLRAVLHLVVDQLEEGFPKSAQQFAMDALGEHLKEARRD